MLFIVEESFSLDYTVIIYPAGNIFHMCNSFTDIALTDEWVTDWLTN